VIDKSKSKKPPLKQLQPPSSITPTTPTPPKPLTPTAIITTTGRT
jgi:hypothetical protein